jgi:hypothetical protein
MLDNLYRNTMVGVTILTLALQLYTLFLIKFKSVPAMHDYCYFLYLLTVSFFQKYIYDCLFLDC